VFWIPVEILGRVNFASKKKGISFTKINKEEKEEIKI